MAARISLRDYQRELAARLQTAASRQAASKLGLQAGAEAWLVDLAEAGEVVPVPPVTPVPLAQPWFRGVANIRGTGVIGGGGITSPASARPTSQDCSPALTPRRDAAPPAAATLSRSESSRW